MDHPKQDATPNKPTRTVSLKANEFRGEIALHSPVPSPHGRVTVLSDSLASLRCVGDTEPALHGMQASMEGSCILLQSSFSFGGDEPKDSPPRTPKRLTSAKLNLQHSKTF